MRVLHIDYQQLRRYGLTRVSWAQKLTFGLIKAQHHVHAFSDRDVAAFEAPFGWRDLGRGKANKRLLETVEAFQPDLVIAGHCDIISNQTLQTIRQLCPSVKIAHCNNDALFVPSNVERIKSRAGVSDAVFVSTGRRDLRQFEGLGTRLYYMPNAVDEAIENLDNSTRSDLPTDLIFCSNSATFTKRLELVKNIKDAVEGEMVFRTYGSFGEPAVWGRAYDHALSESKMGLNLSRQDNHYWCSSARMAQLGGNGILQFTHTGPRFDELFPEETLVYFDGQDDLLAKVREFHHDDARRQAWAANARAFFHNEMSSRLHAQFIVEATLEIPFSHDYVWTHDIYLDGTLK